MFLPTPQVSSELRLSFLFLSFPLPSPPFNIISHWKPNLFCTSISFTQVVKTVIGSSSGIIIWRTPSKEVCNFFFLNFSFNFFFLDLISILIYNFTDNYSVICTIGWFWLMIPVRISAYILILVDDSGENFSFWFFSTISFRIHHVPCCNWWEDKVES